RALPPMGRFDGVIAWHSFFHLRPADQRAMFARFARLCRPGAALMFTSGPAQGEVVGSFAGRPLYHASLDSADYRRLLDRHGVEVRRHVAEDPTCGGATIWLARKGPDSA
ncbi:SAM-dependent methyltransferase, partial [Cribrihabitans sp. XS_ASV171]